MQNSKEPQSVVLFWHVATVTEGGKKGKYSKKRQILGKGQKIEESRREKEKGTYSEERVVAVVASGKGEELKMRGG